MSVCPSVRLSVDCVETVVHVVRLLSPLVGPAVVFLALTAAAKFLG